MRHEFLRILSIVLSLCLMSMAGGNSSSARSRDRSAHPEPGAGGTAEARAAALMVRSMEIVKALRLSLDLPIDPVLDPNGTGIIGAEFTPLTTSLGEVEAKRTSANPAFAALMVAYFREAGLQSGDVVAIGASGSFPALLLATLAAARVMDLEPIVIYSIGASMFGANLPGFTMVDMLSRVRDEGSLPYALAAVSPGGNGDRGTGVLFDEEGAALVGEAARSGLPVIRAASLAESIAERLRIYEAASRGRPIRCFVNIGGASASFGDTPASLRLANGLVRDVGTVPTNPVRGLLFEFAARGIPVIHLLNVRGLARDNGLPFDPVPMPGLTAKRGTRPASETGEAQ